MIYEYVTENSWLGISASVDSTDDIVVDTGSDIVRMPIAEVPKAMLALAVAAGIEPRIHGEGPIGFERVHVAAGHLQNYEREQKAEAVLKAEEAEVLDLAESMINAYFDCEGLTWDRLNEWQQGVLKNCARVALKRIKKEDEE